MRIRLWEIRMEHSGAVQAWGPPLLRLDAKDLSTSAALDRLNVDCERHGSPNAGRETGKD